MHHCAQLEEIATRAFPDYLSIVRYGSSVDRAIEARNDVDILVVVPELPPNNRYTIQLDEHWYMVYATTNDEIERDIATQYFGLGIAGKLFFPTETVAGSDLSELQYRSRLSILQLACDHLAAKVSEPHEIRFLPRALAVIAAAFLCELAPPIAKIWNRVLTVPDIAPAVFGESGHLERLANDLCALNRLIPDGSLLRFAPELLSREATNLDLQSFEFRRMVALNAAETACRGWRPISRWAETINRKYDQARDYPATLRRIESMIEEQCNARSLLR